MNQSYHDENEHRLIMDKAKKLAGRDETSLLRRTAEAEKAWDEQLEADPELAERYAQDRDRQMELLKAKLQAKKAARQEEAVTKENIVEMQVVDKPAEDKTLKKYRFNKKIIGLLVAAVLLMVGGSMASTARNGYRYSSYPELTIKTNVDRHNSKVKVYEDSLDLAYQEIEDRLHIPVIVLGWWPEGMLYIKNNCNNEEMLIEFEYQGQRFYLKESPILDEKSTRALFSERTKNNIVYNPWLKMDINIEKNELKNGKVEYSTEVIKDKGYYYFCGIMKEEVFREIVSQIMYK